MDLSLLSLPKTPEEISCATLEMYYKLIIDLIDRGIELPAQALMSLNNQIKTMDNVILNDYLDTIDEIETNLRNICGVSDILDASLDSNTGDMSFCELLYQCEAFGRLIFNESVRGMFVNLIPTVPEDVKPQLTSDYTLFSTWICKLSLDQILGNMSQILGDRIFDLVKNLKEELLDLFKIDDLIDEYINFLHASGIFELLEQIDTFARCAFAICDYATQSRDTKKDILSRLGLIYNEATNDYEYDKSSSKHYASVIAKEATIKRKIYSLEAIADNKTDNRCVLLKDYLDQ